MLPYSRTANSDNNRGYTNGRPSTWFSPARAENLIPWARPEYPQRGGSILGRIFRPWRGLQSHPSQRQIERAAEATPANISVQRGEVEQVEAESEKWRSQCQRLKKENRRAYQTVKHYREQLQKAEASIIDANERYSLLQGSLESLTAEHVRIIASLTDVLEPVTTEEFRYRFRQLAKAVSVYSRAVVKNSDLEFGHIANDQQVANRCSQKLSLTGLSKHRTMELIMWMFLEDGVFSTWFPVIGTDKYISLNGIRTIERRIFKADPSEGHSQTRQWRRYTASLLARNPCISTINFNRIDITSTLMEYVLNLVSSDTTPRFQPTENDTVNLQNVVTLAHRLAVDLRCQKELYEMPELPDLPIWDEDVMEDVTLESEGMENPNVGCVLFCGIVRREWTEGAGMIDVEYVAKPMVTVVGE